MAHWLTPISCSVVVPSLVKRVECGVCITFPCVFMAHWLTPISCSVVVPSLVKRVECGVCIRFPCVFMAHWLTPISCSVVVMLCGGNIDTTVLGRSLERGLAADGRLVTFCVCLEDRPGSLLALTQLLVEAKASVKDIEHERTWLKGSIYDVEVRH